MHYRILLLAACLATLGSASLQADDLATTNARPESNGFFYGVGLGLNQELYQGYRRRVVPIPMIGYRGERLSVYGPFISYNVVQQGYVNISLRLAPRFAGFDGSDSVVFAGMAKRKSSLDAGVELQVNVQQWRYELGVLADALTHSKGYELNSAMSYQYQKGPFFMVPKLSVYFVDKKMVDYYYGVRSEEATAERAAYQAGSAIHYGLGVTFATPIVAGGMTRLGIEHRWYGDSVAHSPLTDRSRGLQLFFSYSRFF